MLRSLVRYPVKSMQGEDLASAEIRADGLVGDREWAVRDVRTGSLASAKQPRPFGGLLWCRAHHLDGQAVPSVTVPGSEAMPADDLQLQTRLSDHLGTTVEVVAVAGTSRTIRRTDPVDDGVGFDGRTLGPETDDPVATGVPGDAKAVDLAAIHLVTEPTLAALAALVDDADVVAARFRPNLVLDVDVPPFREHELVGHHLTIGEVVLRITFPTPRCVVPTLGQPDVAASPATLRQLAARSRPSVADLGPRTCLGLYADVIHPGRVRRHDAVTIDGARS